MENYKMNMGQIFQLIGEQTVEIRGLRKMNEEMVKENRKLSEQNADMAQQIQKDYGEPT